MRMWFAVDRNASIGMLDDFDGNLRDLIVIVEEIFSKPKSKTLDLLNYLCLSGESVDSVLHRIGRQALAIVSNHVNGIEVTLERDLHRDVLQLMPLAAAHNLHQSHPRFPVIV